MPKTELDAEIEIRFAAERLAFYKQAMRIRVGNSVFGGEHTFADSHNWSIGLLAMSLFDCQLEKHLHFLDALACVLSLEKSVVDAMLTELADQIELSKIFERTGQSV